MRPRLGIKHRRQSLHLHHPDWVIAGLVIVLIGFGVLMVFDASVVEAYHELGDQWYFIKNQSKSAIIGLIAAGVMAFISLKKLEKFSLPIMAVSLLLLVIVLIPGIGIKVQGARRWLDLAGIRFQPSEFAKIASILYLSSWFSRVRPARSFAVLIGLLIGLIMIEPDMGTSLVIIGIVGTMYFLSGVSLKKLMKLVILALVSGVILILLAPYRLNRVKTFPNPA